MYDYSGLELLISKEYDDLLAEIHDGCPVIIWGAGHFGRALLKYFQAYRPPKSMVVWDTSLAGKDLDGLIVQVPDYDKCAENIKINAVIILTVGSDSAFTSCKESLLNSGFKRIIHGNKLYDHICASGALEDYARYMKTNTDNAFAIDDSKLRFYIYEKFAPAGISFADYYLLQDLWAARKIYNEKPETHYDIGSRVDGFVTHLLAFEQKTVLIDIRPLDTCGIDNLTFAQADATELSGIADESIESLSALCSLEHFGLGRYGDAVDPDAHTKAFANIQRVLKKDANLYISVPVAPFSYVEFNAHRVYAPEYILDKFSDMKLVEFAFTTNDGLHAPAAIGEIDSDHDNTFGEQLRFGLFHFKKG